MPDAPNIDLSALVEPVQAIAREAGRLHSGSVRGFDFSVTEKADQSPVTEADLAAHRLAFCAVGRIDARIFLSCPKKRPMSALPNAVVGSGCGWWTRSMALASLFKRSDQFSVNIALIHQHEAVFGLILVAGGSALVITLTGAAALKATDRVSSRPRRIHVAQICHQPIRVTSSEASYRSRRLQDYLQQIGEYRHLFLGRR
jgi:3'(2'), 5'-bisphosphate nucleotidase